jgi:hypothetical protein
MTVASANCIKPSEILLGHSNSVTRDVFIFRHLESKKHMLQLIKGRQPVEEFEFSSTSVEQSVSALRQVVQAHVDDCNIFLTCMNTKPSLIASFLIAEEFPEIQVTCSVPGEYNVEDYSGGSHEISFIDLPAKIP